MTKNWTVRFNTHFIVVDNGGAGSEAPSDLVGAGMTSTGLSCGTAFAAGSAAAGVSGVASEAAAGVASAAGSAAAAGAGSALSTGAAFSSTAAPAASRPPTLTVQLAASMNRKLLEQLRKRVLQLRLNRLLDYILGCLVSDFHLQFVEQFFELRDLDGVHKHVLIQRETARRCRTERGKKLVLYVRGLG